MSWGEHWSTDYEISRRLPIITEPNCGAGPYLHKKHNTIRGDDSESHIAAYGNTGTGKTQCITLPYVKQIAAKKESGIFIDSKGELFQKTGSDFNDYEQKFCVDLSDPYNSPTGWDPLQMPLKLFKSKNKAAVDRACELIDNLWTAVYPYDGPDKFWSNASREFASGLTYSLFEMANPEQINIDSIARMMKLAEKKLGASTLMRILFDSLPLDSHASYHLASYANAPNDTRGSINSVAANGLGVFFRSRGLMELLCNDSLDILNIDTSKPFVLFIILPQEHHDYDAVAGLLVEELTTYLLQSSRKYKNNRLPVRVHILEEMGTVGRSIPNLDELAAQGRGSNLKLMLILQTKSQIDEIFGKDRARTINGCIGITIAFSTNDWDTLEEWSRQCGKKQIMRNGQIVEVPLVTASELAAMPKGRALIIVDHQYKFVSQLPFFYEMYEEKTTNPISFGSRATRKPIKPIELEAWVVDIRNKRREEMFSSMTNRHSQRELSIISHPSKTNSNEIEINTNDLISKIEAKIAALEEEERAEMERQKRPSVFHVCIMSNKGNKEKIAETLSKATGEKTLEVLERLKDLPADFEFKNHNDAQKVQRDIANVGGEALLWTS